MKFFTKEEWAKPPSLHKTNMTIDKYNEILEECFIFTKKFCEKVLEKKRQIYNQDLNRGLCFEINVFANSMYFLHFYSFFNSFKNFNKYDISATCVFLSSKLCNEYLKMDIALEILNKMKESNSSKSNPDIVRFEIEIMALMGFEIDIDIPFNYLELYANEIAEGNSDLKEKITANAFNIIIDSYRRPLCLIFSPKIIALAALNLAYINFKENILEFEFLLKDSDIDKEKFIWCTKELISIIDNKKS